MSDIVERLLRFRPVYGWPEETSTVVEKSLNQVAVDEITRLRADLAAAIEERDRIREALRPFAAMASVNNMQDYAEAPDDCVMTAGSWGNKPLLTFRLGDLRRARAAIEVVAPASPKAETEFCVFDEFAPLPEPGNW